MKTNKLLCAATVLVALSMASCGGNNNANSGRGFGNGLTEAASGNMNA